MKINVPELPTKSDQAQALLNEALDWTDVMESLGLPINKVGTWGKEPHEFAEDPLWQDSWHYLIFNQLGGSGVDSASLFRRT